MRARTLPPSRLHHPSLLHAAIFAGAPADGNPLTPAAAARRAVILCVGFLLSLALKYDILYDDVYRGLTPELTDIFEYNSGIVTIGLLIVVVGTAVVGIFIAGHQIIQAAQRPVIHLKHTFDEPALQLSDANGIRMKWHLFLSHGACCAPLPNEPSPQDAASAC